MISVDDIFIDVVHEYPDLTVNLTLLNATIAEGIPSFTESYVYYFNNDSLSYKLNYKILSNIESNKDFSNWWFLLSTFN